MLFDQIILAKKNRGRTSLFSKSSKSAHVVSAAYLFVPFSGSHRLTLSRSFVDADPSFLQDRSDHLWRSAATTPPTSRFPGDYRQIISRSE